MQETKARLEKLRDAIKEQEIRYSIAEQRENEAMMNVKKKLADNNFQHTLKRVLDFNDKDIESLYISCENKEYDKIEDFVNKVNMLMKKKVDYYEQICSDKQ